ncbi:MAG: hypothetical protein JSR45_10735 [Proteobacteria bacterium]|nr:hypothetical protein [Pseudomonadota bacterium]
MIKTVLTATVLAASLVAGAASAQGYPPMDMSWAIQSQMRNQMVGDQMARAAGMRAYRMLRAARRAGHPYNGTLVLGNHPNTFGDGGYAARSNAQHRALTDYSLRAIQGCTRYHYDAYSRLYVC